MRNGFDRGTNVCGQCSGLACNSRGKSIKQTDVFDEWNVQNRLNTDFVWNWWARDRVYMYVPADFSLTENSLPKNKKMGESETLGSFKYFSFESPFIDLERMGIFFFFFYDLDAIQVRAKWSKMDSLRW